MAVLPPLTTLGDLSIKDFLDEYWQKKPVCIRNALPDFQAHLSANELAGFSLDDDVESRLIIEDSVKRTWTVKHGPLAADTFAHLPENNWTLLVQNVDSLDPEVNQLLQRFRFLPSWRLDDVMLSYSPPGGGVGPHFDYYDVFLLQAQGKRHWQVGQRCDEHSPLIPNQPMKILSNFTATEEWLTQPGDLLYIPANIAHWGRSMTAAITYSIGFRAPSYAELFMDAAQKISAGLSEDHRYRDGPLQACTDDAAYISNSSLDIIQKQLEYLLQDRKALAHVLGTSTTALKPNIDLNSLPLNYSQKNEQNNEQKDVIATAQSLVLSSFCRAAYCDSNKSDQAQLFINGEAYTCSQSFAKTLTSMTSFSTRALNKEDQKLVASLINMGNILIVTENSSVVDKHNDI